MIGNTSEPCEILEWDTAFFGFRIARVVGEVMTPELVRQIDAWCQRGGVRCLYFLTGVDDIEATTLAEVNDFHLVDIRVTLRHRPPYRRGEYRERGNIAARIRPSRATDVASLQSIARRSYHDTRFYFDAHFPRHLSDALYETWIRLSCEGEADVVLVAELDGAPAGYISCHLDKVSLIGKVGLVGISAQSQGLGIGQALVLSALDWFTTHGAREVLVVTQGRNCKAQRLYQRCGFLTSQLQLWYHKWYPSWESTHE